VWGETGEGRVKTKCELNSYKLLIGHYVSGISGREQSDGDCESVKRAYFSKQEREMLRRKKREDL
jgi:hypothetical protein